MCVRGVCIHTCIRTYVSTDRPTSQPPRPTVDPPQSLDLSFLPATHRPTTPPCHAVSKQATKPSTKYLLHLRLLVVLPCQLHQPHFPTRLQHDHLRHACLPCLRACRQRSGGYCCETRRPRLRVVLVGKGCGAADCCCSPRLPRTCCSSSLAAPAPVAKDEGVRSVSVSKDIPCILFRLCHLGRARRAAAPQASTRSNEEARIWRLGAKGPPVIVFFKSGATSQEPASNTPHSRPRRRPHHSQVARGLMIGGPVCDSIGGVLGPPQASPALPTRQCSETERARRPRGREPPLPPSSKHGAIGSEGGGLG